jgi:hypothetical protein
MSSDIVFIARLAPDAGFRLICPKIPFFYVQLSRRRSYFMKQIKEKLRRKVKYWSISYKQASRPDRLSLGMFALMMLVYLWWAFLVS